MDTEAVLLHNNSSNRQGGDGKAHKKKGITIVHRGTKRPRMHHPPIVNRQEIISNGDTGGLHNNSGHHLSSIGVVDPVVRAALVVLLLLHGKEDHLKCTLPNYRHPVLGDLCHSIYIIRALQIPTNGHKEDKAVIICHHHNKDPVDHEHLLK